MVHVHAFIETTWTLIFSLQATEVVKALDASVLFLHVLKANHSPQIATTWHSAGSLATAVIRSRTEHSWIYM